jgi:4-amino-4-deoxy-L-arabinose transferase-like glycosyltransferase
MLSVGWEVKMEITDRMSQAFWAVESEMSVRNMGDPIMDQLLASKNKVSTGAEAASRAQAQRRRVVASMWIMVAVALIVRVVVMRFSYLSLLDPARDHYLPGWENGHFTFGREYERIAKSIVAGQGFSSPYPYPTGPTALVGPVYAYLLAGVFKLFGVFTTASTLAALALNNLMSSLICLPVFFIARRSFGPKIAVWSGWAWAFYPHSIAGSNAWIWDTILGTLLLTLLLLYTLNLERSTNYMAWLGYGLLWAIAALTNASVLSVLPFFGAWVFLRQWRSRTLRLGPIMAASLMFLIGVAPWVWRSSQIYGRFVAFRGNLGLEVMVGNSSDTSHPSNWNETPGSNLAELQELRRLGEPAYMAEKQREAVRVIGNRPLWFAGQTLRRILYTWTNVWDFPPRWTFDDSGFPDVLVYTMFSLLAFIGLRWAIRNRRQETIPLLIPLIFFPIIYYVTHQDDGRFRHPIDPVVIIFSVCGLCSLLSKRAGELSQGAAQECSVGQRGANRCAEDTVR